MNPALQIRGLTKRYPGFALDSFDLEIPAGTTVGLIGENGAGKSTAVRCLLGLVRLNSGTVTMPALGIGANDFLRIRRNCGYVPEEAIAYDWMTVGRMLQFQAAFYPTWDHALAQDLVRRFRLEPAKKCGHLSKGMRVKLHLAAALAHRPGLLVLDEPTSGLDPVARDELLEYLADLRREARTAVLFSSHILSDLEGGADEIVMLGAGRVLLRASMARVRSAWRKIRVKTATADTTQVGGARVHASSDAGSGERVCLVETGEGTGSGGGEPVSLDEIYLALARGVVR